MYTVTQDDIRLLKQKEKIIYVKIEVKDTCNGLYQHVLYRGRDFVCDDHRRNHLET